MHHVLAHLRQKVEPGVIKDGRGDAGVCVCNLLDLVGQAEHHLCQELSVGLKNICSMTLAAGETPQAQSGVTMNVFLKTRDFCPLAAQRIFPKDE